MLPNPLVILTALLTVAEARTHISATGRCGSEKGLTCAGSSFGSCCSRSGWCGSTKDYCGTGCQSGWGNCNTYTAPQPPSNKPPTSKPVSKDARCGSAHGGQTCQGSAFGTCCSKYGYCGSSSGYCEASSCQKDYGTCQGSAPSPVGTTLTSIVLPSQPALTCSPTTITLAAQTKTVTLSATVTTVTVPGDEKTVTEVATRLLTTAETQVFTNVQTTVEIQTITLPAETETQTTTLPAETTTLPAETETETKTTTLTLTDTTTLPAETGTTTVTLPVETQSVTQVQTQTATTTATVTASPSASICATNPVINGDFERDLSVGWQIIGISTAVFRRANEQQAPAGRELLQQWSSNAGVMRAFQAVPVCAGSTYEVSFYARAMAGKTNVMLSVDGENLAGGDINAVDWALAPRVASGKFTAGSGAVLLKLETTFAGNGYANVLIDGVKLTRLD